MRIALTVGHSLLKNGSYTSASGEDCGGVNEYKYNKKLMKKVKEYLESDGHSVDLYICPEKVFTAASQEKSWKLTRLNAKNYDLVVEGHLNCYNGKAHGTEVLYVSEGGKKYAKRVQKKLVSAGFTDRDVQKRTNLYMLNGTKATTIMTESFFCDSKSDYKIGKAVNKIAAVPLALFIPRPTTAIRAKLLSMYNWSGCTLDLISSRIVVSLPANLSV